jgi:hypothetical protein
MRNITQRDTESAFVVLRQIQKTKRNTEIILSGSLQLISVDLCVKNQHNNE